MKKRRRLHTLKSMKEKRRTLRARATPAEKALWQLLRKRQLKGRRFRRQYSIGHYIVDFYCPDEHLAVELDGGVHDDPLRAHYDTERQYFLEEQGVTVVRFENRRVFQDPEQVMETIAWHFESR